MKRIVLFSVLLIVIQYSVKAQNENPVYKDKNASIETRIKDLVSRMNLDEKIFQLNQYTAGQNDNVNNIGEATKSIPSEIGSLIYFGDNPVFRNSIQKKAMEESRLGIPILFGFDVIHGFRTVYPISLAQACSWNPGLVSE
ncbi:MAG: glycoside hydrolase family 3 N-terminal domain-containing protein, partial [Bacteroidales bacterium]|nr:glycoside hydrolase family 3 N-terminal domain-containing protein [Bacteroidales bacterium]